MIMLSKGFTGSAGSALVLAQAFYSSAGAAGRAKSVTVCFALNLPDARIIFVRFDERKPDQHLREPLYQSGKV